MGYFDSSENSKRVHFKTIIISDVHLGTAGSKAREVVRFLRRYTCDTLILNGDIIDAWELKKYGSWKVKHTRFLKVVLGMMEEFNTKVIYLHGNHDDFLDNILPLTINNLSIQMDYVYESFGKKYYIVHGDIFDSVTTHFKWIAKLGSIGYTFLLWLNKCFNYLRKMFGKKPYSFSQYIKTKVKTAVSPTSSYEKQLTQLAKFKECHAIVCGHTHKPAMKNLGDVMYMNSGDWVESMTALTEDFEGTWQLVRYNDIFEIDDSKTNPKQDEDAEIDEVAEFNFLKTFNQIKSRFTV
ncbi:MAG: UDP-2,3-diacylglucosamine diphosphatase [Microscillaceae bacterium]|jgi:UDP-2,3-diacylglucosamine pyrophosphatase LpxH|nr:UDP-2,3-diacylglucosamine diphosphatase [Microscillaceae bacterium]